MSIQTKQSQYIVKDKESMISNQEIVEKKWKFDGIFKVLASIFYGFFFGMLPAVFKFANGAVESNEVVISSVIGLLLMSLLSISFIYWVFKGDIKKHLRLSYAITHFVNAILLAAGILVCTILYPVNNNDASINTDILNRQFLMMVYYAAWSVIMPIVVSLMLLQVKKRFPLSWSKIPFVNILWIPLVVVQAMIYFAQKVNQGNDNERLMYLVVSFVVVLLVMIAFLFSTIWIRRFREILLGERTESEVRAINDWESARVLSIISSFIAGITFLVAFLWDEKDIFNISHIVIYVDLAINALIVITYLWIVIYVKTLNVKDKQKLYKVSKLFKSIDNILLLDMFSWFILVKTSIIQGVYISPDVEPNIVQFSLLTIASFVSIILLYVIDVVASLNVPNLKNNTSSIITIASMFVLLVFTIVFNTALKGSAVEMPKWLTLSMMLIPLIGISISLMIRITSVSKIFKSNDNYKKVSKSNEALANNDKDLSNDEANEENKIDKVNVKGGK